jgi:protein SCO1
MTTKAMTLAAGATLLLGLSAPAFAAGEGPDQLPGELEGVGIDVKHDAQLPLDAVFTDDEGRTAPLSDRLVEGKPTLLVLAYFKCPMLCGLVLNAVTDSLKELAWTPGEEFNVLTVSIDPRESVELGREKKKSLVAALGRPAAAKGWTLLTGTDENIKKLTGAVGFKYRFLPERNDFAHAAGIFIVTPQGKLSRTITGLSYEPRTLRLSLVEAADGKIGSILDQILLYCFHYDPQRGKYTPVIMNITRLAGALTVLAVFGMIGGFLWKERRDQRNALAARVVEPQVGPQVSSPLQGSQP